MNNEQVRAWIGCAEMYSDDQVLLRGAAGEVNMNVGDLLGILRAMLLRPEGAVAKDAERYRWLNRQDNFVAHIEKMGRTRYYRLKCGEVLDRWIDERIKEESSTPQGERNG